MTGRRAGRWAGVQAGGQAERQKGRYVKYKRPCPPTISIHHDFNCYIKHLKFVQPIIKAPYHTISCH